MHNGPPHLAAAKGHFLGSIMACAPNTQYFDSEEEAIAASFSLGIKHCAVLQFLSQHHGITLSLRTLRKQMRCMSLRRHNSLKCSEEALREAVRTELCTSGRSVRYRQIWINQWVAHHISVPHSQTIAHYVLCCPLVRRLCMPLKAHANNKPHTITDTHTLNKQPKNVGC